MRLYFTFLFFFLSLKATAQLRVSGIVFDNSKLNYVEGVRVVSTGGGLAFTDSMGRYALKAGSADSLFFVYNNKPTQKFAISSMTNPGQFDIALPMRIQGKYSVLKEVVVHSRSYSEDSAANREGYENIFSYKKPKIESSISPGGGVGMDLDALINMFRFRHNRQMKAFQQRLEQQEQDKYIDYRFSKKNVHRITRLSGAALDTFMVWYRPAYEIVSRSDEMSFDEYVLNAYYQYKRITGVGELKKND